MWNNVPWIDETIATADAPSQTNTTDIWPKIEADFLYAYQNLPATQPEVGKSE